jgi:hypothetical protein
MVNLQTENHAPRTRKGAYARCAAQSSRDLSIPKEPRGED